MTEPRRALSTRQKRTVAAAIAAVALAITGISLKQCSGSSPHTPTRSGPQCTKGCPCGDTCIDCSLTCNIKQDKCTKGCPCGNACIDCSLTCRR